MASDLGGRGHLIFASRHCCVGVEGGFVLSRGGPILYSSFLSSYVLCVFELSTPTDIELIL